jgi:hypothetical protein
MSCEHFGLLPILDLVIAVITKIVDIFYYVLTFDIFFGIPSKIAKVERLIFAAARAWQKAFAFI